MMRKLLFIALALLGGVSPAFAEQCHRSYKFSVDTQSKFDFKQTQIKRLKLEGYLSVRPLNADKDGRWWAVQLTDVTGTANSALKLEDPTYHIPFAVKRTRRGALVEFWFPYELEDVEQNKLKGFAYLLQFQNAPFPGRESDALGPYKVLYKKQGEAISKSKQRYLKASDALSANKAIDGIDILASIHMMTTDDCWFSTVSGDETLVFHGPIDSFTLQTQQRYKITPVDTERVSSLIWDMPRDLSEWKLKEEGKRPTATELAKTRKDLIRRLPALENAQLSARDLRARLEQYDSALNSLLNVFERKELSDAFERRLFNALGLLDTPGSQALLCDILMSDTHSELQRFRAARALTQGEGDLSEYAQEQLAKILDGDFQFDSSEMKGSILMATGTIIGNRSGSAGMETLKQKLVDQLNAAYDTEDKAFLVASAGNTHDPALTTTVSRFADDESPRVRANSAIALGMFSGTEARDALTSMLGKESEARVQQAILSAMGNHTLDESGVKKVIDMATGSNDENVRLRAIKALGSQKNNRQEIETVLRNILESETSRRNFEQIVKELHRK